MICLAPTVIAGNWVLGNVALVSDALHQLPKTRVVFRKPIVPRSQNQWPRGPRHTQRFKKKPRGHKDREVEPCGLCLRLHSAGFETGEGLVYRLGAPPFELQELDDATRGRLHCEATVPAFEATEQDG